MKFPITRESLQEFDFAREQADRKEEAIQKRFDLILEQLCNEFKQSMSANIREKKFVWRNIHQIKHVPGIPDNDMEREKYLPRFVEKLKETFIGCEIIIDPLKTYLIIDWS